MVIKIVSKNRKEEVTEAKYFTTLPTSIEKDSDYWYFKIKDYRSGNDNLLFNTYEDVEKLVDDMYVCEKTCAVCDVVERIKALGITLKK